jgi:antitoxin component YwqK of YwqJK toxin-antitoxin module
MSRCLFWIAALSVATLLLPEFGTNRSAEHSERRTHYLSGEVHEIIPFDAAGLMDGTVREFYEDGTPMRESNYSHGTWHLIRGYWPNGTLQEESRSGVFTDSHKYWNEDGTPIP